VPAATPAERNTPPESPLESQDERVLRRIPAETIVVSAVLAVPVIFLSGLPAGLLFLGGGALAALGFLWLRQSLTRFLLRDGAGALRFAILLYALRLLLICGVFFIIILLFPRKILAFGAGFSVIILVMLAEGARALLRMKTWKA
jgi:hypothetical protein